MSIHATQHVACFKVIDIVDMGPTPKTRKERYWVKVDFGNGKIGAFHCESKSLTNCFQMIETLGNQCKAMDSRKFKQFMSEKNAKPLFFDITDHGKKGDQVITYEQHRTKHDLVYAFDQNPSHTIAEDVLKYLKKYAKLQKVKPVSSHPIPNNLKVVLKEVPPHKLNENA